MFVSISLQGIAIAPSHNVLQYSRYLLHVLMGLQVLSKIASADIVVDMRAVELGIKLGQGGSGMVYKATMSGMPVVAKSLMSQMNVSLIHLNPFGPRILRRTLE